jgi:hypothetical protein
MNWGERWKYRFWLFFKGIKIYDVLKSILSVFGALWGVIEMLAFFGQPEVGDFLKSIWWLFLATGIIVIIYHHRHKMYFPFEVEKRDVKISIRIADILNATGSKVIPINHKFDADNNGIVAQSSSLLKYFIQDRYKGQHQHLETDIKNSIVDDDTWYNNFKIENSIDQYKIGTVVPIFKDEQHYYLLASSTLNDQNRSKCTEENLRTSLNELWTYLDIKGNKDHLLIPIIGTGRGRISLTRTEVIKETVLSFLASLSSTSGSYIEELSIVIHPRDIKKYKIDIVELIDFIRLHCNNTNYTVSNGQPNGVGIE